MRMAESKFASRRSDRSRCAFVKLADLKFAFLKLDRFNLPFERSAFSKFAFIKKVARLFIRFNSALFYTEKGQQLEQRYDKIHLVPFGERIPGQKLFPFLGKIRLGQAEFAPGDSLKLFQPVPDVQVGCLICFEVVFPEVAAGLVRRGAQILVNLTNDGWYGNSSGPYQHLALARLRAIVTRRSIARAANTGISAMIDPAGRVLCRAGYGRRSALALELPLNDGVTFAVRYSAWLQLLLFLLLVGGMVICRRMKPLSNRRENT